MGLKKILDYFKRLMISLLKRVSQLYIVSKILNSCCIAFIFHKMQFYGTTWHTFQYKWVDVEKTLRPEEPMVGITLAVVGQWLSFWPVLFPSHAFFWITAYIHCFLSYWSPTGEQLEEFWPVVATSLTEWWLPKMRCLCFLDFFTGGLYLVSGYSDSSFVLILFSTLLTLSL